MADPSSPGPGPSSFGVGAGREASGGVGAGREASVGDDGFGGLDAAGPFSALRAAAEAWDAAGAEGAPPVAETLTAIEPLLGRSFLLGQPNLAGMGVGAWDLAVADPVAAMGIDPAARARRMVGEGLLGNLLNPEEPEADAPRDPAAPGRVADLLAALDRVRAQQASLGAETPAPVRTGLADLHDALRRRIAQERRHDPAVDAALRKGQAATVGDRLPAPGALAEPEAPVGDRAPSTVVEARRPRPVDDPYAAALETTLARARTAEPVAAEAAPAVGALRTRIEVAAEQARRAVAKADQAVQAEVAPDAAAGAAAHRALDRLRRLLAEEVALTGGRPGAPLRADASSGDPAGAQPGTVGAAAVDTLAVRGAFPATPRAAASAGDLTPAPGLTEVPIWSGRGAGARVVGYLAAGERLVALERQGDRVRVANPGGGKPGWVDARWLDDGRAPWPQPLDAPTAPLPFAGATPSAPAGRPGAAPGLGRLAALVAQATGRPVTSLLADALGPTSLAQDRAAPPDAAEPPGAAAERQRARRARGADGALSAEAVAALETTPVTVEQVNIDGLEGPDSAHRRAVVAGALQKLPGRLAQRGEGRKGLDGRAGRVDVRVDVRAGEAISVQADRLADQLAGAILRSGAQVVGTLHLGVHGHRDGGGEGPRELLARLAAEDREGLAERLVGERRELDGALRQRLTRFFGHDFKDVLVFSGPMSGALARSLSAEAVTHGQMIFFDPKHFRTDTARGEALMAHELAHTRQGEAGDARLKEAEALATEAAYLDWIQPGGAPLAQETPLDPTAPGLGGAGPSAAGVFTAQTDRQLATSEGPRADTAEHEERVNQVLAHVRGLLTEGADVEGERIGRLGPLVTFKTR